MRSEAYAAAKTRHDEASRVVDAYEVQLRTRSKRWLKAVNAAESKFAAMELSEASTQLAWAKQHERDAWRTLHAMKPNV